MSESITISIQIRDIDGKLMPTSVTVNAPEGNSIFEMSASDHRMMGLLRFTDRLAPVLSASVSALSKLQKRPLP